MKILREEVENGVPSSGGLTDLFDGVIYTSYNITSDELNILCEKVTDEEMDLFVDGLGTTDSSPTFSQIRKGLEVRNKYVEYYKPKP